MGAETDILLVVPLRDPQADHEKNITETQMGGRGFYRNGQHFSKTSRVSPENKRRLEISHGPEEPGEGRQFTAP